MSGVFNFRNDRLSTVETEPLGVIDIGSNSVRLVVYEGAIRSAAPLFNEKVLCGLGRELSSTGKLADESVEQALQALTRFHAVARIIGVKNLRPIATAAVRDAKNGSDFIRRGEKIIGGKIEILSGSREAELVAQGIRMGFQAPDGISGDLGGGSLELVDIGSNGLKGSVTVPLGALRLMDATKGNPGKAAKLIDKELANIEWLEQGEARAFYVVGGTWRSLARVHMEQTDYPLRVTHGYALSPQETLRFLKSIINAKKVSAIPGVDVVNKARREALPYGALLLQKVLERVQPSEVVMSVYGIREGTLFSLLPRHEQAKDPLISFCDHYARLVSRSVDHAWELCNWTDAIFDHPDLTETPDERRLRYAACLVSDIGWRSHPDYRGDQSLNLIAHAGMAGIDHPGRIFLALSLYYRHAGTGPGSGSAFSDRLKSAITRQQNTRARIVGAAIRVAHMLSMGKAGVIDETRLIFDDDKLVLQIPAVHGELDGERLRRRLDGLAQLVECEPTVRIG